MAEELIEFGNETLSNFSLSNSSVPAFTPYEKRIETYVVPVIFGLIFIIGVIGNGTLILIFIRNRAMRNVPNTYIFSLALADLVVILTSVPLTSVVYVFDSWPWGEPLCILSEFAKDVSIGVSVFTLTALSSDRFFAIVDPLRKFHAHGGSKRATRVTIAIAISIWILAILCGLPALLGTNVKHFESSDVSFDACYPFPSEWGPNYPKFIIMARFLIYYTIPLGIITVFYILIARHLTFTANIPGEKIQSAVRQAQARKKVAIAVLAFVVIFGICFFPYHLFFLWFYYNPTSGEDYNAFWHVLRIVGFCLSFANSCANPVALYCVSGAFRKHFNRYLCCRSRSPTRHPDFAAQTTTIISTGSKKYGAKYNACAPTTSMFQETTVTMFQNGNSKASLS